MERHKKSNPYALARRKGAPRGASDADQPRDADLASRPEKPHVKDTPGGPHLPQMIIIIVSAVCILTVSVIAIPITVSPFESFTD